MNIKESSKTAFRSLRANKMRSLLTMLGIIIGVAAVIALTSLGNGLSNLIDGEINEVGSNLFYVSNATQSGFPSLTPADMALMLKEEAVLGTAGVATIPSAVKSEYEGTLTAVAAVSDNYFTLTGSTEIAEGSFPSETAVAQTVLGITVADYLFPDGNAVGQTVTIDNVEFTVVGVLAETAEAGAGMIVPPGAPEGTVPLGFLPPVDDTVYASYEAAKTHLGLPLTQNDEPALTTIVAEALAETEVETAIAQATAVLRQAHALKAAAEDDFSMQSSVALADTFSTITGALTLFLGAVSGISLLVGGIGIMNIMLVSVTERTREIGIRKSLGATRRDILAQFLLEALMLSLLGGAIGLLLGMAISLAAGTPIGIVASVDVSTILLAVSFSTAVGLVFGIYPAWRAAKLRPIEALRYE